MMRRFACSAAACAQLLVLGEMTATTAARADDPKDPAMRNWAAHARDAAITRSLNRAELGHVVARDRGPYAGYPSHGARYRSYADSRAAYQRRYAQWQRTVDACRAGDYAACEH
jgi:hypothetical protein